MAMQQQLWSINALSTELKRDRRTLSKLLSNLPPADEKQVGNRIERRWRLLDVLNHMSRPDSFEADFEAWMNNFLGKSLFPHLLDSNDFVGTMLYNALDVGLTKYQAIRMYQAAALAIACGISEVTEVQDMQFETSQLMDFLAEHGVDNYAENCWPEIDVPG